MLPVRLCLWCPVSFRPHPRLANRQKCCGSPDCKQKQKAFCQARWKANNKLPCLENQQNWRKVNPNYWRNYRAAHPDYANKNRKQTRIRKKLSLVQTGLQRRIDILQLTVNQRFLWDVSRFAKCPRSHTPLLYAKSWGHDSPFIERIP